MKTDILFIDIACSKSYDWTTPEESPLGGTESATVRLAEIFGRNGHKVVVVQRFDRVLSESPNGVMYVGMGWAQAIKPKNVIYIRGKGHWDFYKEAKKFLWLHDAVYPGENYQIKDWVSGMNENNVLGITVSDWHKENVLKAAPDMNLIRLYSPLDELCYQEPRVYDKDQLVWLASPHKGLKKALKIFSQLQAIQPQMKLAVFNPGYFPSEYPDAWNVLGVGSQTRQAVRSVLSQSLCLFYPTEFEETFGMIAAESEALGTPVATYKVGALAESVQSSGFCKGPSDLIDKVLSWRNNPASRPVVSGQDQLKAQAVYQSWRDHLSL